MKHIITFGVFSALLFTSAGAVLADSTPEHTRVTVTRSGDTSPDRTDRSRDTRGSTDDEGAPDEGIVLTVEQNNGEGPVDITFTANGDTGSANITVTINGVVQTNNGKQSTGGNTPGANGQNGADGANGDGTDDETEDEVTEAADEEEVDPRTTRPSRDTRPTR